jgi:hypothetical protein
MGAVCILCLCAPAPHRFYYDCLMKPNAKSVTTALRKVRGGRLGVLVCQQHCGLLAYMVVPCLGFCMLAGRKVVGCLTRLSFATSGLPQLYC